MSNFNGYRCPVCGKAFVQGDDVVVCPDCGTPHHRECYRSLGHCANESGHATGEQWSPAPSGGEEEIPTPQAAIICPRCHSHNPAGNIFCQVCGQQLTAGPAAGPSPYGPQGPQQERGYRAAGQAGPFPNAAPGQEGIPPWVQSLFTQVMEEPEIAPGISNREVCDYVGPNNLVFLLRFQRLMSTGLKISLNWSAFFFSFFYCFYRKMYKLGAALMAVVILAFVPVFWFALPLFAEVWNQYGVLSVEALLSLTSPAAQRFYFAAQIFRIIVFLVGFFCGLFFNVAYYRHVCKDIQALQQKGHFSSGSPEYQYALIRQGGVNFSAVLVAVSILIVLYILACVGLTYQLI